MEYLKENLRPHPSKLLLSNLNTKSRLVNHKCMTIYLLFNNILIILTIIHYIYDKNIF